MKQGALIFDKDSGRYDIRFGLNDYHGGLHCGNVLTCSHEANGSLPGLK